MHWKRSKSGRRYLYRSVRRGHRVISQYVGSGLVAEYAKRTDALRRANQQAQRRAWDQEQRHLDQIDGVIRELCRTADELVMIELLLEGYHRHQWNWRKRRVKRSKNRAA